MICAACCYMELVTTVMHLQKIFNLLLFLPVPLVLYFFFKIWYLKTRREGRRYQHVLLLCTFLTGGILKGLFLRKFCVCCLCKYVLCHVCVETNFVDFKEFYMTFTQNNLEMD